MVIQVFSSDLLRELFEDRIWRVFRPQTFPTANSADRGLRGLAFETKYPASIVPVRPSPVL